MPEWLLKFLVPLALQFGIPWLITWLKKVLPWLPLSDEFVKALQDFINALVPHKMAMKTAKRDAKQKLKKMCVGIGCGPETKK